MPCHHPHNPEFNPKLRINEEEYADITLGIFLFADAEFGVELGIASGDKATVTLPSAILNGDADDEITLEAMIFVNSLKAWNRGSAHMLSLQTDSGGDDRAGFANRPGNRSHYPRRRPRSQSSPPSWIMGAITRSICKTCSTVPSREAISTSKSANSREDPHPCQPLTRLARMRIFPRIC